MKKAMRYVLTITIDVIKFIVRTMDKIIFLVTGRKPVTRKLVEEGEDADLYEIRWTEVPTYMIVRRIMRG